MTLKTDDDIEKMINGMYGCYSCNSENVYGAISKNEKVLALCCNNRDCIAELLKQTKTHGMREIKHISEIPLKQIVEREGRFSCHQ